MALNAPDNFEALDELKQTWLDVRSGASSLGDRIKRWSDSEWSAIEHFRRAEAARLANERFASAVRRVN
jgi:hypothetical protein